MSDLRRRDHQGRLPGPHRVAGPVLRLLNREYGTQVVAGTNPKKAGTDVDGIPIFASVADAVKETGATGVVHLHPRAGRARRGDGRGRGRHRRSSSSSPRACPRTTRRGSTTSSSATSRTCSCSARTAPASSARASATSASPPATSPRQGGPVGIVSRSGTLTYQALYELKQKDIGVTTCVGIGGDPVPGTTLHRLPRAFEADPETKAVMMIGEIGGSAEEEAAEFIKTKMTKPVVVLHRRRHRAPGQEDGPRRRDRLGRQGHGGGQDGGAARRRASRSA